MDLTTSDGSVPAGTVRTDPSGSVSVSVDSVGRSIMSVGGPVFARRAIGALALISSVTYPIAITSATGFTLYVTVPVSRRRVFQHRYHSRRSCRRDRRIRR